MDMQQGRFAPIATAIAVGTVLLGIFIAAGGPAADIGSSWSVLAAAIAVFVLPGCAATALSAWRTASRRGAVLHAAAMRVMQDVAPLEAESLPLAQVRSLTEVQVERHQRDRRAAAQRAERDTMLAS